MKVFKILVIAAGVVMALVLVIELVLRFVMPVEMEPALRLELSNDIPGLAEKRVTFEMNGDGLRTYQWSKKRPSDCIRLLVVGSNSTNHMMQNAPETWWGQLAQKLEAQTGKRVEAAAFGNLQNGQILTGLAHTKRLLDKSAADFDCIIVKYGLGDVLEHSSDYVFDSAKMARLQLPPKEGFKYKIAKISQIARRVRSGRIRDSRRARQAQLAQHNYYASWLQSSFNAYRERPFVTRIDRKDDPEKEFLQGIEGFIELAREKGKKLVFVGEPSLHFEFLTFPETGRMSSLGHAGSGAEDLSRVSPEWIQREMDRYYFDAGVLCEKRGVPFVSLNGRVPRTLTFFITDVLYTDEGASKAAEIVLPAVAKAVN